MSFSASSRQAWTDSLLHPAHAAEHWIHARVHAFRQTAERRRMLRLLQELRDRDPRLFEETGVDPIDLPPPKADFIALLPQTVIAGTYFDWSKSANRGGH